ncbi:uncharacterized protein EV154DRAFT_240518 [Mucor mucedo]|uniref:uncharacterized protein n=1 Tax=Mucor mucedo TaxID=29922 RepID=UPI002221034C|nr:uncharacterized protein EV154DRAFT_240518 [Mucor mucedo]KAI7896479.1 hypothetical protein EV154DRAFT_240518 [Mucor mucedo]
MKLSPLTLSVCAAVVLLTQQADAKAATTAIQENADWTKDQVQAYLDKYQITYDKNDEGLFDTVQKYRDAAMVNAGLFINDKSNTVQRLIEGLKNKLETKYKLKADDVQAFTDDVQHELRQLELSGSLTQDKVKQSLDKLQHKAIKQKYLTAAQYKEISKDLQSSFATPTWFQKLFGPSTSGYFTDDAFHNWISNTITHRLQENKDLTKEQIQSIVDTLKSAIASTSSSVQDLSKLASAAWWKQLSTDIEKNAKLKQGQVTGIVDSLKDEVNAYKIFAMDYAGEASDKTQSVLGSATQYLVNTGSYLLSFIQPVKSAEERAAASASSAAASATDAAAASASSARYAAAASASSAAGAATDAAYGAAYGAGNSVSSAAAAATDAAASARDAAAASAASIHSQASQSVNDAKNSFGHFWKQKELETYKKIGYTEAHIDWVENYLSKTFQDKRNFAKETVQSAMHTIRDYLVSAKVQTAAHVDHQLKSIENLIESWRKTVVHNEL